MKKIVQRMKKLLIFSGKNDFKKPFSVNHFLLQFFVKIRHHTIALRSFILDDSEAFF